MKRLPLVWGLLLLPGLAGAAITFEAPMDKSSEKLWSNETSRISCTLNYVAPDYGLMRFSTLSGRNPQLAFEIIPQAGITEESTLRVISAPPPWRAGGPRRELGSIRLYKGFNPFLGDTVSWNMLGALKTGLQIIMPYRDSKLANGALMVPSISPIGFNHAFSDFLNCRNNLLSVGFDDVSMLAFAFTEKTDELRPESIKRLKEQIEYVTFDKAINLIRITAFAYDGADHDENVAMRKKRAQVIRDYFVKGGVDEKIIEIVEHTSEEAETHELAVQSYGAGVGGHHAIVYLERDQYLINRSLELQMPDIGKEVH